MTVVWAGGDPQDFLANQVGAVPPQIPDDARERIENAGYNSDYVIQNDVNVDLDVDKDERPQQITTTTLFNNPLFVESARELMPLFRSDAPSEDVSDLEAAQWGLELMGNFNWNITDMGSMVYQMQDSSMRERVAFYNMMTAYDKLPNFTWDGSMRMITGLGTDITSYIGLGTLGAGLLARLGAKHAGKAGLKAFFKSTLPYAAVAGIEGGAYGGLDDAMRQITAIRADKQGEFDPGKSATAVGVGAFAGTGLGFAVPAAAPVVAKGVQTFRDGFNRMVKDAQSGKLSMGVGPSDKEVSGSPWSRENISQSFINEADVKLLDDHGIDVESVEHLTDEGVLSTFDNDARLEFEFGVDRSLRGGDPNKPYQVPSELMGKAEINKLRRGLEGKSTPAMEEARAQELRAQYQEGVFTDDPDVLTYAELAERYPEKTEMLQAAKRVDDQMRQAIKAVMSGTSKASQYTFSKNVKGRVDVEGREVRKAKAARISTEERGIINQLSKKNTLPAKEIESEYRRLKEMYPVRDGWAPFTIKDVKRNKDGFLEIDVQQEAYGFHKPKGAEKAPPKPDAKLVRKSSAAMVKDVVALFERAKGGDKAAQAIIEHKTWYSQMRDRLRAEFGSMADVFADVIGATSAQTNVRQNWNNSIEVMRKFSRGDYDEPLHRLKTWIDGGGKLGSGKPKNGGYVDLHMRVRKDAEARGLSKEDAFADAQAAYPLITKDNGKLFNTNSPQTMLALLDLFRQKVAGGSPKTYNFTGNLIGYSDLATIDVWAARYLRRLAGMPRLMPKAEQGVAGMFNTKATAATGEFGFGQEVFANAARELREKGIDLADDDLQAVVWFMEKELWARQGYTTRAGEGGSLEFEADLAGAVDPEAITAARKAVETDPTFRKREELRETLDDPKAQQAFEKQQARLNELSGFIDASTPVQKRNWVMSEMGIEDKAVANAQVKVLRQEVASLKREAKKREGLEPRLERLTEEQSTAKVEGEKVLKEQAAPVRRFTAGLSQDLDEPKKIATDAEMNDAQKRLSSVVDNDETVIFGKTTSTRGRYFIDDTPYDERAFDFEYVARTDHDPADVVKQVVQEAKDANQESTFFSEALVPGKIRDANPGAEIYFNRKLTDLEADELTDEINKIGLKTGFTFATDFRFANLKAKGANLGEYTGMRLQYIPEFAGTEGLPEAEKVINKYLNDLLENKDFVSNVRKVEYDTEVFFRDKGDYDAELTGGVRKGRRAAWRK